jgi:hypothetical protein
MSDIEIEWSETTNQWVVIDGGRVSGYYKTYEEASQRVDSLKEYYYGK